LFFGDGLDNTGIIEITSKPFFEAVLVKIRSLERIWK
jgi:hypothetical protein